MRRFTVIPFEPDAKPVEIAVLDEAMLLQVVVEWDCREAAVFEGDRYRFSFATVGVGPLCIFRREMPVPKRLD